MLIQLSLDKKLIKKTTTNCQVRNAWNKMREGRPSTFSWLFLAKESGSNRRLVATHARCLWQDFWRVYFQLQMNTMPKHTFQKLKSVPLMRI